MSETIRKALEHIPVPKMVRVRKEFGGSQVSDPVTQLNLERRLPLEKSTSHRH